MSVHVAAAIDGDALTGYAQGLVATKEEDRSCNILRPLQVPLWCIREVKFPDLLRRYPFQFRLPHKLPVLHRRGHIAGANAVDPDVIGSELAGHRLRKAYYGEL